jgi:hypothetical protein
MKIRIEKGNGETFEVFDVQDKQEVVIKPRNAAITMKEEESLTDMFNYLMDMARKR